MYKKYLNDKHKKVVCFGNDSKGNGVVDEFFKYDESTEKYFMVEKYNNDIGKCGMFFSSYQDSGNGELGILDNELFIRSYLNYVNKERISFYYYTKRGTIGRCMVTAHFDGSYKITVMNGFIGDYGITFKNNTFNFYYENITKREEKPILKADDSFKFKTEPFFMANFNDWEVKFMNGNLDNRFSEITGQHVLYNAMDGFVYERTFPQNIEKPDEGISKYIGEYLAGSRTGLGCFRDPFDNFYLGKWYKNRFNGNGVIDRKDRASFGYFTSGKQNGLFFEVFENAVHIVRFENGNFTYPFYRLHYQNLQFEKVDKNNQVVQSYACPFEIKYKQDEIKNIQSVDKSNQNSSANNCDLQKQSTAGAQNIVNINANANKNNATYSEKSDQNAQNACRTQTAQVKENPAIRVYKREDYGTDCYYEGYFVNGQRHGKGSCFWSSGLKYVGEWANGKKHGNGKLNFANGDCYEGGFKNDEYEGEGTYYYANGSYKSGVWQKGECVKIIKNYDPLERIFKREDYSDGCYYEGEFMHGKRNGRGTCHWKDGSKYVGEWSGGVRKGRGVFTFSNGDYYEGSFKNDAFEGEGTYYYANGSYKKGVWQNGNCIKEIETYNAKEITKKQTVTAIKKESNAKNNKTKQTKASETLKVEKTSVNVHNEKVVNSGVVDINSQEFKQAMSIFSYKIKEGNEVVISSCKNPPKNLVIPEGVTSIYQNAFYNNMPENIESVVIPSTVTKIGSRAFFRCVNLKKLVIGENVKKIGGWAFCETGLTEVYIPDSVEVVEKMAFSFFDTDKQIEISVSAKCKTQDAFSKNCIIKTRK